MAKTAFLFPGQGAQSVGMAKRVLDCSGEMFARASDILGYDLARLCSEGPSEMLDSTEYAQPALFVTSLAALEMLKSEKADVVNACTAAAGLSLGEYTALAFAGVFSFEDGVRLVQKRGKAMQDAADATPSGMISVLGLDYDAVLALCAKAKNECQLDHGVLQIANLLGPGNIVISGNNVLCEKAAELAPAAGAMKAIPLAVAGAFHTPLMQPADRILATAVENITFSAPKIPVYSNVDAQPHGDPADIKRLLIKQILAPVRWEDTMRVLLSQEYGTFYEVGPGRVLKGLLKRIDRKVECISTLDG